MKNNNKYFWGVVYDRTKNNCDNATRNADR
jgi:hypothetical protein